MTSGAAPTPASCHIGQSRPPRHRRRRHADAGRVPVALVLGTACYRLYRHPLVMFGIGPAYLFMLQQRLPIGLMREWKAWLSTMATNFAIAVIAATLIWFIGIKALLAVHLPIMLIAATIGVWLFYVQHQFEHTTWDGDGDWDLHTAALHGSSYYDLPPILRGSRPISACTTCTTCAAASRIIAFPK